MRFELHNARRLLEDGAPILGLRAHDLVDLALTDDRIPLFADAHAVQKRDDIFEAAGLHVQKIFTFARAVKPTGHGDLFVLDIEHVRRIIEYERDFAIRKRAARIRAVEDDVRHGGAAHGLCRLFAEHPAHRVGYVGFSAAVRPDDTGNAVVELDRSFVGKRFEPDQPYFLKIHLYPSFFNARNSDSAARVLAICLLSPQPHALLPSASTR